MIFESLSESAERGELLLVEGGLCRYHLCRDGRLTIREILVLPAVRGQGIGTRLLDWLKAVGAAQILARCPADLEANRWYSARGFQMIATETARSGRLINVWRLELS